VVRASANRVVVLLFVNQTTTSTRLDGPKVDLNRVRMTLDRVDGTWLVSDVDAL
jgi:Mce-associated membrane protein